MKVLRVTELGSSIAIPERSPGEKRFAIFHGPACRSKVKKAYPYRFDMSKDSFPVGNAIDWQQMEYILRLANPPKSDALANPVRVLCRRPNSLTHDGGCVCLLDMYSETEETATLFGWNQEVTRLGQGIVFRSVRLRGGGARLAIEMEYPVLLCQPGAKFEWVKNGLRHGAHYDYQAEWDGVNFHVAQQLGVTNLMERFHLDEQSERRKALRWNV